MQKDNKLNFGSLAYQQEDCKFWGMFTLEDELRLLGKLRSFLGELIWLELSLILDKICIGFLFSVFTWYYS